MTNATQNLITTTSMNTLAGRTRRAALAILLLGGVAAAQTTGTLTVHGPETPTANILTGHQSRLGDIGTRNIVWQTPDVHSVTGQSFAVPGSGPTTLNGIYLYLTFYWPKFASYAVPAFSLKIFEGDEVEQNDPIATFSYTTTDLGDNTVTSSNWLHFGFDGGVPVTAGQTYSFLMVFDSLDDDNYISFRRAKDNDAFPDGAELRAGNNYAIDQWAANPWNPLGADNERPRKLGGDLWFYLEGPATGGDTKPVVTKIEYNDTNDEISLWWDAEVGATYTVNWSADLFDFTGEVANDVADTATQPFTFTSPSTMADALFFTVSKNEP